MLPPSLGPSILPEMEGANLRTRLKAFNRVEYKKFKTILIFSRKTRFNYEEKFGTYVYLCMSVYLNPVLRHSLCTLHLPMAMHLAG